MADAAIPVFSDFFDEGYSVGGHAGAPAQDGDSPQFDIADTRSPAEMSAAIRSLGLAPVFKYWEPLEGESFHCGRASGGSGA